MLLLVVAAALVVWLLCNGLLSYVRFEKLCRLVAEFENALAELNSTEGLDGNSSNPFRRAQLARLVRGEFSDHQQPEIKRTAALLRRDGCLAGVAFVLLSIVVFWMLFRYT